jgi:hypothetical protein
MNEEERILAEVERRRKRAQELGLFDLLTLFRDNLEFLEGGPDPERLPKSVTDVKVIDTTSGSDSIQAREIFFENKSYLFAFKQKYGTDPSGNLDLTGHLILIRGGQTLLDLYFLGEIDQWIGTVWKPFRVEAFIEDEWVHEIEVFRQEVLDRAGQRQQRSRAEAKKKELEELKSKFGLT